MALVLQDRVREQASTTGTGTFTLSGAYDGYRTFASCVPDGSVVYYCIHNTAAGFQTEWEVGYGTYSANTLVRTSVYSSSNSDAAVNFSAGTKEVFITQPAEQAIYQEVNGSLRLVGGTIGLTQDGTEGTTLPNTSFQAFTTGNYYMQANQQNLSNGSSASSDWVSTADNGSDTENYMDMGMASSTYSAADYSAQKPNSGYLISTGNDLRIIAGKYGATSPGPQDIVLIAGSLLDTEERARVYGDTGNVNIGGGVNATDTGELLQVEGSTRIAGAATFGSTVTLNANPTLDMQAATKQYVDNAASAGLTVHTPVRTEAVGNLNATYNNGTAGVGATLTNAGTQAALVCDGITVNVNDRILVMDQTDQTQNGVYVVTNTGSGSTNWVLTRASDADTYGINDPNALDDGAYFFVSEGTTAAYESYVCTTVGIITFGTTAITFQQFSSVPSYVVNAPLQLSGNVLSLSGTVAATNGGTGTSTVTTGDLLYGSATNTWSNLAKGSAYKSLVMNAGGTNVEWNAVALNQSGAVSGALPATNGGTGQSSYTLGDTLYSSASNTLSKLSGNTTTTKKYLQQQGDGTNSAAPSWQQIAAADISGLAASATTDTTNASNISSGTLPSGRLSGAYTGVTGVGTLTAGTWTASTVGVGYGGTGLTSYTTGDIVYASASGTLASLADVATGNALISGGVGVAPSYGKIGLTTHISGTLAVANGGTGATSLTGYVYGNGTSAMTASTTIPGSAISGNISGNAAYATSAGSVTYSLTPGSYLTGSAYNGGAAQTFAVDATSANTASKVVARDASGNFSAGTITATLSGNVTGNVTGNVSGSSGSCTGNAATATTASSCSGNAATATLATKASTLSQGGGSGTGMTFNWSGQSGQPTWLWGSNDGTNIYVWNPSNFSVNYATTAGSASSASSASTSSQVTINYNNDSNSTYQMLWGSGNSVYGTGGIYCNPYTDYLYSGSFYCGNWFRSSGATGWYNDSYGGGINMADTTWVRTYGSKSFYCDQSIAAAGNVTAYYSDMRLKTKVGGIENALDKVDSLEGFYYVENELAKSFGYKNDKQQVALSAQAVKAVMPEAVSLAAFDMETHETTGEITSKSGEEYLTVDYARLVPLLVEAIKELRAEVKALKGD